MAQNLPAPAYQEYASRWLANSDFALLTLAEQGLFDRLRKYLWVSEQLPSNFAKLAILLRVDPFELISLFPAVAQFFTIDGDWIRSPDLDDYRKHLEDHRAASARGGKISAAVRASKLELVK